jgi:hypothetical protein
LLIQESYDTKFDLPTCAKYFDVLENCMHIPGSAAATAMINSCPLFDKRLCMRSDYVDDGLGATRYRLACIGQMDGDSS